MLYFLFPFFYTLLPISYSLYPFINPITDGCIPLPYLFAIPYILFAIPCFPYPIPYALFTIPYLLYPIHSTLFPRLYLTYLLPTHLLPKNSKPSFFLFPVSCTLLYPSCYTLFAIPSLLFPICYTYLLYPIPYTLFAIPYSHNLICYTLCRFPGHCSLLNSTLNMACTKSNDLQPRWKSKSIHSASNLFTRSYLLL